jgi:dihydroxy-acid dehydratase
MQPGSCSDQPVLDVVSAFQSYGKYVEMGATAEAEKVRLETIRGSCRKEGGACGGTLFFLPRSLCRSIDRVRSAGMYTANTMASAAEVMGMTLPGSSSTPAAYQEKKDECDAIGATMRAMLEKNVRPRDIMTREAFENAIVLTMILGGSTNAVLHLIAIAHSVGVHLSIDDFQTVSDRIPFLADLKPSGKYVMEDVHKIGGIPGSSLPSSLPSLHTDPEQPRSYPQVPPREQAHQRRHHDRYDQDARRESRVRPLPPSRSRPPPPLVEPDQINGSPPHLEG